MNICITASCYDTLETIGVKEYSQQIRFLVCIMPKAAAVKRRILRYNSCLVENRLKIN